MKWPLIFCRFTFVRTNINSLNPRIIRHDYLQQWNMTLRDRDGLLDVFTYTVSGVLLFMIFFIHWLFTYKAVIKNSFIMRVIRSLPARCCS